MTEINNLKANLQAELNTNQKLSASDRQNVENGVSRHTQNNTVKTDTIALTVEATQLQSVHKVLETTSEVDNERVEALRSAIADGSYKIDATELAKNMIKHEKELNGNIDNLLSS